MTRKFAIAAAAGALLLTATVPFVVSAQEPASSAEATYKEIEQALGFVPDFVKAFPKAAVAGAWREEKDLELSDKTALTPKVKALISLAVAAQIPCDYCIYTDTLTARGLGASDEEIKEAVAIAALTRHSSTILHGLQVDMATYRKDADRLAQQK